MQNLIGHLQNNDLFKVKENLMLSMKMSSNGRVVIPVTVRRALQLKEGDTVLWELADGQARLSTRRSQLESARKLFQQVCPPNEQNSVATFLAERRAQTPAP
jgi:AbrB family looped-hinge helix DNA binding protein